MYLKNRTIQDKSTKYRKIQDNFLIFPKYRKYRKYRRNGSPDIAKAKQAELDQWKKEDVYMEHIDEGLDCCISLRWVLKENVATGEKLVKAILCAWGFEEEQHFRTDSPTCCKEGLHLKCCIISSNKWLLNSLDVKTAFLQVKLIERAAYVGPPKEAQTNKVWKLRKCVYGLTDAS